MSIVRRYRGLRISDQHHARLADLKTALDREMYSIVEEALDDAYQRHRRNPAIGPVLQKLEEVREAKRLRRDD